MSNFLKTPDSLATPHPKIPHRGYFEIGVYQPKTGANIGTLMRSAYQLGAAGVFVIGRRYKWQCTDTCRADKHIPLREFQSFEDFLTARPYGSLLVAVESPDYGGKYLSGFAHPERAIYLLGSEDSGLPKSIVERCNQVVSIESVRTYSYNVAVAGSLVMYDRVAKSIRV